MIINKETKIFETNSLYPQRDWYNEGNFVIDETKSENQEMIDTIKTHAPHIIIEHQDGVITKVIVDEVAEQEEEMLKSLEPDASEIEKAERQIQLIDDLNELGVL